MIDSRAFWEVKPLAIVSALILMGSTVLFSVRAASRALSDSPEVGGYRVTTREVIRDSNAAVLDIEVEARAGSAVRVVADSEGKGGVMSQVSGDPAGNKERGIVRVVLLADTMKWSGGEGVKFVLKASTSSSQATSSQVGPLPAGKGLDDLLSVAIKPGTATANGPLPLVTFRGTSWRIVVDEPKP